MLSYLACFSEQRAGDFYSMGFFLVVGDIVYPIVIDVVNNKRQEEKCVQEKVTDEFQPSTRGIPKRKKIKRFAKSRYSRRVYQQRH